MSTSNIKDVVKEKYGQAALRVYTGRSSCCGGGSVLDPCCDPITLNLYSDSEGGEVPEEALRASLGCGNPTALAKLNPGETVLDLGSGGGIDVLLSARRVGPTGKAYGLDMTDEMLALAEKNRAEAGIENVKFLKGEIEDILLPDETVDVVISNCVINLSADKDRVLREAFRVLRHGGRFAVSDVVINAEAELPASVKDDLAAWIGCIAGALTVAEYKEKLAAAGFTDIQVEPVRRYYVADMVAQGFASMIDQLSTEQRMQIDGRIVSAFIRARKR